MKGEHASLGWTLLVGGAVVAEIEALRRRRHDCTLSAATRRTFHTDAPTGRVAFLLGWGALTVWFTRHVIRG